jgi:hypothetical protein
MPGSILLVPRRPDGGPTRRFLREIIEGLWRVYYSPADTRDQTALEYLAALSVLARWIDKANVEIP